MIRSVSSVARAVCLTLVASFVPCALSEVAASGEVAPSGAPQQPSAPQSPTTPAGRMTVRAHRISQPLAVDGTLDEGFYGSVPAMTDFVQVEPQAGKPATERTEGWLAFDDRNVYVAFRVWDTQMDRLVATEMRRDNGTIWSGNDIIVFVFDTFNDRRSSLSFTVNALGGRSDGQVINERQFNPDWNPVWDLQVGRFDGGWTLEAALPFKSLKYQPQSTQVWGFNAMRVKRSKNEISTLSPVPQAQGQQGVEQPAFAATLLGIEVPSRGGSLDVKPYVTSSLSTNNAVTPKVHNKTSGDLGVDARYAVTRNLAADLTYNTDFAQVEADQQQVNLTRFSLFFPEKREFFLENQGVFSFGGVAVGSLNAGTSDAPILFYSRRIGLQDGRAVPIIGGGRLTGRMGAFGLGLINVQTGDDPVTGAGGANVTVARLKRDILRRSSIGTMVTSRTGVGASAERQTTLGLDGTLVPLPNLQVNTYWSMTDTGGLQSQTSTMDRSSYRAQLDFTGDRYGAQAERMLIGARFAPAVGFVRRADMVRTYGQFRFSPRAPISSRVRKYLMQGTVDNVANTRGRLETRLATAEAALDFRNADKLGVTYTHNYEFLPAPFRIATGVTLPSAAYDFDTVKLNFNMGQQRPVSANLSAEYGTFYSGHKATLTVARGRIPVSNQLSVEPTYSVNRVILPEGRFLAHVGGSRITYTMTPLMFVSALVQYNSSARTISANARFRWEYRPGSEMFVVYNEERDTRLPGTPALGNRSLIVKVNRLFRF